MKPLPPKTAIRGGVAAVAAQRASMVRSAGCDPGDPDPERIRAERATPREHRGGKQGTGLLSAHSSGATRLRLLGPCDANDDPTSAAAASGLCLATFLSACLSGGKSPQAPNTSSSSSSSSGS